MARTIQNAHVSVSVDAHGRLVSLRNKATGTELIAHREAAEAWRMVVPRGRHTVDFVYGSRQAAPRITVAKASGIQSIVTEYEGPRAGGDALDVTARFILSLEDGSGKIAARVEIDNRGARQIDEVEFPVIGGLGALPLDGRRRGIELIWAEDNGRFYGDVLSDGLPEIGRESDQFVRELETTFFANGPRGVWLDLYGRAEGLYLGFHGAGDFAFKLEKHPKDVPNRPAHHYPPGTKRWIRAWGLFVAQVKPGTTWRSQEVTFMPHAGQWHSGADVYSAYRHRSIVISRPPRWMDGFVGWSEILGKTYLGEVFHDFRHCADEAIRDAKVSGLDLVFYYGHTNIGAEGADYDQSPAADLGGEGRLQGDARPSAPRRLPGDAAGPFAPVDQQRSPAVRRRGPVAIRRAGQVAQARRGAVVEGDVPVLPASVGADAGVGRDVSVLQGLA